MKKHIWILLAQFLMLQLATVGIGGNASLAKTMTAGLHESTAALTSFDMTAAPEALLMPSEQEINTNSPFGMHPAYVLEPGYNRNPYDDAQYLGIKWNRPHIYLFWFMVQPNINSTRLDFSFTDRLIRDVPTGISVLANIAPEGPRNENHARPGSYLPIDTEKYKAFVRAIVERYDGDGVQDMPGLRSPILHWQVDNEPSVTIKRDFAALQLMTYTSIKEACPSCQVLIGGAAQPILQRVFETNPVRYFNWFSSNYEPILKELNGNGFDIFDFHWYGKADGDYKKIKTIYEELKARLKKYNFGSAEIWVTEMGTYSGAPVVSGPLGAYPSQTEGDQAADLLKRYVLSMSMGIKKVFLAFGLMEGFMGDDGYFDHTGLIYNGRGVNDPGMGVRKLSYYAYKKMTDTLEGSDWNLIDVIQANNDIYIYKFLKNGKSIWVCWNDNKTTPQNVKITLLDNVTNVEITEAVPKYRTGREVADYSSAFDKLPWTFTDDTHGTIEFSLSDTPVFVQQN
jgi:hypothetical protein